MNIFTQWSSSVPSYLLYVGTRYNFTSAIIPWRSLIFLSFQNSVMDYTFLSIVYYSLRYCHISSGRFSCRPRPLRSGLTSGENVEDPYLWCVTYALWNLITLQIVLFVSSFRVSLPPVHVCTVDCWRFIWKFSGNRNCLCRIEVDRFSHSPCVVPSNVFYITNDDLRRPYIFIGV